ncbi:FAD-dependent monooxygenase [Nocardia sp. NPDC024068]|uniref:FAD-dependent monooxygenase n=1 Tax=Nocardia sp. NPDC024068 TaxID=3157197 RepID=UPI0033D77B42
MPENSATTRRTEHHDVVIAGAGPNGLMLAAELALAGHRPVVLESLAEPSTEPKANGLIGQVVRLLDMRGLYREFTGSPEPPRPLPAYMFSGLPLSFTEVPDNPLHAWGIPQPRLVRLLHRWTRGLGVEVRWRHRLADLVPGPDAVTLTIDGPDGVHTLTTGYLIGADGGRSTVRKLAGIGFPGTTVTDEVTRIAHISLPEGLRDTDGGLRVPGLGPVPFGHSRHEGGTFAFAELEAGRPLLVTTEYHEPDEPTAQPMTLPEMRASVRRVLGTDLPFDAPGGPGPHALRRTVGQNTRQAEHYRAGRIFLVGDAAHVHSAMGGPGLNLGLQDSMNLGWKLAAELDGRAPADLLDTYHEERHPVGARVMMSSLAQTALQRPGPEVTALRSLLAELLAQPRTTARIAGLLAGADTRYDIGDTHPLAGHLVPDAELVTATGPGRIAELLHAARPVLLDFGGGDIAASATGWRDRVDLVHATANAAPVRALLIRPDGYVAWATDDPAPGGEGLPTALTRWFGPPATVADTARTLSARPAR